MHDPSWRGPSIGPSSVGVSGVAGSCPMPSAGGVVQDLYVPITDFEFAVGEVGSCKAFNSRGVLDDILSFYTGNGPGRDMKMLFSGHCVECDTVPGDGWSEYSIADEHLTATHFFYASDDCDRLTILYTQRYSLQTCMASPASNDGTNYLAICGEPVVGTCPRPDEGFEIRDFDIGASCQYPMNRFVAWNSSRIGQCVSDFSAATEKAGFVPSGVQGARVCCTQDSATVYFFRDAACGNPHNTSRGISVSLGTCAYSDELGSYYRAQCAVTQPSCPPLSGEQVAGDEAARSQFRGGEVAGDAAVEIGGGSPVVVVVVIVVVLAALWATRNKWLTGDCKGKLNKVMHGEDLEFEQQKKLEELEEKRKKKKKDAEKAKIFDQYRAVSFAPDKGKAATTQDEEVVPLPGETDVEAADLDASDAAHRAAREAAEAERKPKRRDDTERRSKSSKRSSSTREKSSRGGRESGRERKKDKGKGKRSSKQAAPENADDQPSRRRGAAQHSLKDMRNLEQAKVASDSRRGDSLTACRALFDRIDVDGSGTLEREEIAMLATKMGRGLKSAELDSAMEAMDADGNGSVDFDEFYQCKFACGSARLAWLWR